MKKLSYGVLFFVGVIATGCIKDKTIPLDTNIEYDGAFNRNIIDSILNVTMEHPLFQEAISSDEFKLSGITKIGQEIGVYYYSNGLVALLLSDEKEEVVFSYIVENNTNRKIEVFEVEFKFDSQNKPDQFKIDTYYSSNVNNKVSDESFGDCMKDAIDELYNDWSDDPLGTAACLFTGPQCAVGAAIACTILTIDN